MLSDSDHAGIDFMSQAVYGIQPVHCLAWELLNVYVTENSAISVAFNLNWYDRLLLPLAFNKFFTSKYFTPSHSKGNALCLKILWNYYNVYTLKTIVLCAFCARVRDQVQ